MKVTLIKPNIGRMKHSLYIDEGRMEPLQLGVLAGMTPPDIEVALVDDRCEPVPYDEPTDLAAITVETYTARRAYEISAAYRRRGVPVVLGGFHPTLIPDEAAAHADAIVTGDAEPVWSQLLEDAGAGSLRPRYHGATHIPQGGTLPRRDLFRGKGYLPISLIQFGRGCRFACTYCAISSYFRRGYTARPVDDVVREIEAQDRRTLFFVDDNIVAHHPSAKALFRALIPLKVRWVSQGSINMVYDRELMDLMAASGCLGNVIGFESIHPEGLRELKKSPNLRAAGDFEHEVGILREYGLQTWAAFVVGHDHDTPETLDLQYQFALRHKFTFAAWNILMPYPGTPLYETLRNQGRLLYDGQWWLHPEYRFNHAAFQPALMAPHELTQQAFALRAAWNHPATVLRRFFEPKTNMRSLTRMGVYWAYNPLFRREAFKKQGMHFGLDPDAIHPRSLPLDAASNPAGKVAGEGGEW